MNRKRKRLIVGALVALEVMICAAIVALFLSSGQALRNPRIFYVANTRTEGTVEESFETDVPATLELNNAYGDVRITASDETRILVKANKQAWGQNKAEAEAKLEALKVEMTLEGGRLRIDVDDPDEGMVYAFASTRASQVNFEISVPRQTAVIVNTRTGRVTLEGSEGDANLTSRYGPVVVQDVTGDLEVSTNNGDVSVLRCGSPEASVRLDSTFGNISLRQVTAQELTLNSNNGQLDLDEITVSNDLRLDSRYGQIDLDNVRARTLTVRSQSGSVSLYDGQFDGALDVFTQYGAVAVTRTEAGEYRIETNNGAIKLDGGHGSLWLHSRYGNITARNAHDATLDMVSGNGRLTFEGSLSVEMDHQLESNYGSVTLRLPSDTAVFVDASTDYGRIRCEFDVLVKGEGDEEERRTSGDELRGAINDGSNRLRIKTRNGDIDIETLD